MPAEFQACNTTTGTCLSLPVDQAYFTLNCSDKATQSKMEHSMKMFPPNFDIYGGKAYCEDGDGGQVEGIFALSSDTETMSFPVESMTYSVTCGGGIAEGNYQYTDERKVNRVGSASCNKFGPGR